jgi:hypothetical protein
MRAMLCGAVTVGLISLGSATLRADDNASLKALIEKSIAANGGREKLSKNKALTMKLKGKANAQGMMFDFTMDLLAQEPDKSKFNMDVDVMGMKINIVQVVNGDMGWTKNPATNEFEAMSKEQMTEHKEQSYARRIESLLDLNKKEYTLAPLGESKLGDQDVIGIRVSSAGHRDVSLYFDKNTSLLAKAETRAKDVMMGDQEFTQETLYSDYKDADGLKYPAKMVVRRDGVEYVNGDVTEWTPSEKLDDNDFAKP